MYGLLLESLSDAIKDKYGEEVWESIREKASIRHASFRSHKIYSETILKRVVRATHQVTGVPTDELMTWIGEAFVSHMVKYSYDSILEVLGQNLRDFLNGLDNLHEYLRFSYPKIKPPSFFIEKEHHRGLTLHYRSRRKGFVHYVKGQITHVARHYYKTPIEIRVVKVEEVMDRTHVVMELLFDNQGYSEVEVGDLTVIDTSQMESSFFFSAFPFHILFDKNMLIQNVGASLSLVFPGLSQQTLDEMFVLTRPMVEFSIENVLFYTNNVFELVSMDPVDKYMNDIGSSDSSPCTTTCSFTDNEVPDSSMKLKLRGQMMYMPEWKAIIFLGTPVMKSLQCLSTLGLYINDLSMHDSSRDMILASIHQSAELKLALDEEEEKSSKLQESMSELDLEMKRTNSMLYKMIPKTVADRLRNGEPTVDTCEGNVCDQTRVHGKKLKLNIMKASLKKLFDMVTILFSDVVGFTHICSQITPMAVVSLLNSMYTKFDRLSENFDVYKVETIGDAYMVVSGAPTVTTDHAVRICTMATSMMHMMSEIMDPSTGDNLKIRIGVHSGPVVAGVVGIKMPRYCLFGDTVNIASTMENNGEAEKIHISEYTKALLEGSSYTFEKRGTLDSKLKGPLTTYWLKY